MADYVTMGAINNKNRILQPKVLQAYRSGNLSLDALQNESSPLRDIYRDTYKYIQYPQTLSNDELRMIRNVTAQRFGRK